MDSNISAQERPLIPDAEFLAWRSPQVGQTNPTDLTNPWWTWLVRTRMNGYQANKLWDGPSSFDAGPVWCFDRFGQTTTTLPDGRAIYIAGEHEDHYDPDFHIYNDVVIVSPGGECRILGYPTDAFPPTDFHTATLIGNHIILIGCLGYPQDRRPGETQVLELSLDTWAVRKIVTRGDGPGWISRHTATLSTSGDGIVVSGGEVLRDAEQDLWDNAEDWSLDLENWAWTRLTHRDWRQWRLMRVDRQRNQLWQMRQAIWHRKVGWKDEFARDMSRFRETMGFEPDLDLIPALYRLDEHTQELPEEEDEYNVVRVRIDGVTVKLIEDGFSIHAVVQGELAAAREAALQQSLREKLSRLDGGAWEVIEPVSSR
jgi:hypothetical protein